MFEEVHSIEERGEIVHIGDVTVAAVAFEPDVELSELAKLCITKTCIVCCSPEWCLSG